MSMVPGDKSSEFLSGLGDLFQYGVMKRIDAEYATQAGPSASPDQVAHLDENGRPIQAGTTSGAADSKKTMMIAGGVAVAAVLLVVTVVLLKR